MIAMGIQSLVVSYFSAVSLKRIYTLTTHSLKKIRDELRGERESE
jgi:hypothetical protein